jgi:Flp pilus assembly protein TadB
MTYGLQFGILLGVVFGLGLFVAVLAVVGLPERPTGRPPRARRLPRGSQLTTKIAIALVAGGLTLLFTRWVVAALAIAALAFFWDKVVGGDKQERVGIARLEAMASWTESLRDTIAGAVGLEQAIPATAVNAGAAVRPSLNLLVDRLRIREPLPNALLAFAEDVDDPSADVICGALVLNARLRGPGLRDVLTALAVSAREELDLRRHIEASRKSVRRSVRIVLVIVLGVMAGLSFFNRTYVKPYAGLEGQMVLLLVVAFLGGGLVWLRSLASDRKTERFLVPEDPAVAAARRAAAEEEVHASASRRLAAS